MKDKKKYSYNQINFYLFYEKIQKNQKSTNNKQQTILFLTHNK